MIDLEKLDLDKLDTSTECVILPYEIEGMKIHMLDEYFGYIEQYADYREDYCTRLFVTAEGVNEKGEVTCWLGLCTVSGPEKGLRECRHTHFFANGYVFYMNARRMRLMLDFLETKYDMD